MDAEAMASAEGQSSGQMADRESRLEQLGMGSRISIFWDGTYYPATIIGKYGSSPNTYTFLYDDSSRRPLSRGHETFDLSILPFKVLDDAVPEDACAAISVATYTKMKYSNTRELYKDLPIYVLKQENVLRQCLNIYIESLPGKWVRITDMVDAICNDLSPAGSYLICTGQYHVDKETGIRNYGETVRQNLEATREERRADYETKVERLKHFFANNPDVYDIQGYEVDEETGRIRFEVCKAVVDLTANSDDEFA